MGVIQLPDELQRVIERQVAEGRAANATAFLEQAVMRMVEDTSSEEDGIRATIEAGSADIAGGRFKTIATREDERRLHDGIMDRLQSRVSADS